MLDTMERVLGGLWRHSLANACAARAITRVKGLSTPEDVTIPSLLHDFGKVPLAVLWREEYTKVISLAEKHGMPMFQAEKELLDVTHAEAGAWLAERWNLPGALVESIRYHHEPHRSKTFPVQTALVHVADVLTITCGLGFSGSAHVPPFSEAALKTVGLDGTDTEEIVTLTRVLLEEAEGTLADSEEPPEQPL